MGNGERIGKLGSQIERLMDGKWISGEQLPQRLPADELHRDIGEILVLADAIDRDDVRVIEGGGEARLLFEAREIAGEFRRPIAGAP